MRQRGLWSYRFCRKQLYYQTTATTFTNYLTLKFAQISQYSKAIFVKVLKSIIFCSEIILGNFYRHLAISFWSHW